MSENVKQEASGEGVKTVLSKARVLVEIAGWHMRAFLGDVMLLLDMLRSYFKVKYPSLPALPVATIVPTLLHILNQIDAAPDIIPIIGDSNDMAALAARLAVCKLEIERFKRWKSQSSPPGKKT